MAISTEYESEVDGRAGEEGEAEEEELAEWGERNDKREEAVEDECEFLRSESSV